MRNKKSLLMLLSLCFLLTLTLFPINIKGQADIPYTFDTDVLYTEDDITVFDDSTDKLSNAKNVSTFTGTYNATYSFTNEADFTQGTSIDFVDGVSAEVATDIIEGVRGHSKILRVFNVGGSDYAEHDQTISNTGHKEFWVRSLDVSKQSRYFFRENGGTRVLLRIDGGNFEHVWNGGGTTDVLRSAVNGVWYHVEIQWYADDTVDIYINKELLVNGVAIYLPMTLGINQFRMWIFDTTSYLDGYGEISDTNYNIGDNFIPYSIVDISIKEVDRWEFAYSSFEVLYAIGSDTFSDWGEIDTGSDLVNIGANPLWGADRVISITHFAPVVDVLGIERYFGLNGSIFNVTCQLEFQDFGAAGNEFQLQVLSSVGTIISDIYFAFNDLRHNPGAVVLRGALGDNEVYTLNLYINYNEEFSVLRFSIDGVPTNVYYIPLMTFGLEGISEVRCLLSGTAGDDMDVDLDYVGVYSNDTSVSTEFGHLRINEVVPFVGFPSNVWNFNEFNLVNFDMIGDSSIWVSEGPTYLFGISQISEIAHNEVYNGTDTANVYGLSDFSAGFLVPDPILWFQFYGQFQFNEIELGGVRLIEGVDEHILEFTFGNVDANESYFYVDSSNRLQFRHIANDSNLEFIQARFNINNRSSDDSAIFFRSVITDRALGFFRVNFTTVSNFFPLLTSQGNSRIILSQGLNIRDYVILITDNDNDDISGLTTGFVSNVELIFITNIDVSIITSSLIDIIIPLVMIIIPTLGLSARVGKNGIVPIFILMSLLLVVTEVIPVWLFFVIAVSSALFIFIKRSEVLF